MSGVVYVLQPFVRWIHTYTLCELSVVDCSALCTTYCSLRGVRRTIVQRREKVTTSRLMAWAAKRVDFSFSIHEERRAASEGGQAHLHRWRHHAINTALHAPCCSSLEPATQKPAVSMRSSVVERFNVLAVSNRLLQLFLFVHATHWLRAFQSAL